ncbi:G-type lectin S-receptor-like serine/threonine-protein kinase RLK1 [Morella rubra]|uniref:non-specific serine/threonine protein kinase n=1 Tax=Morella rubra TaxID=262757 RepID=A0A6A1WIH7_9ROSI|nr:G-type lectin S-receptor-like serine/threonine-protein kinase RLK1 [Morella rubra]
MTGGFKEELGRGSFTTVYKGEILNGQKVVAVKMPEKVFAEGERVFQTEMKVIGRTHRRNLVRLLWYCHDGTQRLLIYEYMSNRSLANTLFMLEKQPCLDERMRIARDIARGILYLHEECKRQIIHCNIKPQNILMDDNGFAKISDFGLAKLLTQDQTRTYTGIKGTKGVKMNLPEEEAVIEEWVYQCFEAGDLDKLHVDEAVDKKQLERMVKLGTWCIQDEPSLVGKALGEELVGRLKECLSLIEDENHMLLQLIRVPPLVEFMILLSGW